MTSLRSASHLDLLSLKEGVGFTIRVLLLGCELIENGEGHNPLERASKLRSPLSTKSLSAILKSSGAFASLYIFSWGLYPQEGVT